MGFSLIIKALIEAKKPFIGHNCMYDILFIYRQFIGDLPNSYIQFAKEWNMLFPYTYDTKFMSSNSKISFRTRLEQLYPKFNNDDQFKNNIAWKFDSKNEFT